MLRVAWTKKLEWLVVALVGATAVALHIRLALFVGALWRDEANSINLATVSTFSEFRHFLEFDSFPALFFGVLRTWTAIFGAQNDDALRGLGFLIGLGILGAVWLNARAFGVRLPVLSLALVGLNPMIIRYGDSIRAYGLGILLILLTLRSFWRLVEMMEFPSRKRIGLALLCALLSVHCLYYNSVLLFAIAIGAAAVAARRRSWRTVTIIFAIGFICALSLLLYLPVMARVREWTFMVYHPASFAWLWKRGTHVLGSPRAMEVWLWVALVLGGLCLPLGYAILGLVRHKKRQTSHLPDAVLFAAITIFVGITAYACFLRALNYYTQPWYYITLTAFVACNLEIIFGAWPSARSGLRLARPAVALALLCFAAGPAWNEMKIRHTNADLIAARLEGISTEGDLILLPHWENAISFLRYYHGPPETVTLPPIADHRFHSYDLVIAQMETPDAHLPVLAKMEQALRAGHRVYFVGELPVPEATVHLPILPPFQRSEIGRAPRYADIWQLYAGQFLGAHATKLGDISLDFPSYDRVQDYENLVLGAAEGWRD